MTTKLFGSIYIKHGSADNRSAEVRKTELRGQGVFAKQAIRELEIIARFDGPIYTAKKASELPTADIRDHAIQIAENTWIDSTGIARYINHSCEPNCGVSQIDIYDKHPGNMIVAKRYIKRGEELSFDYSMTEDSDWEMNCLCSTSSCRGIIRAYGTLNEDQKRTMDGYISPWLRVKYNR